MDANELQDAVLRNTRDISEIHRRLAEMLDRETRIGTILSQLRQRLQNYLVTFDRDKYKSTDQRLLIHALANEILILDRCGHDLGAIGAKFMLAIAALLEDRHQAALDYFKEFLLGAGPEDRNLSNAYYLAGMICYNRRDYPRASEYMEKAFTLSPESNRDWQARIYVAELAHLQRKSRETVEKAFWDIEEGLKVIEDAPQHNFLRATLYLKLGNCYAGTFLEPQQQNEMINPTLAVQYYKQARRWCPRLADTESLLPVIVNYSLAQALLMAKSVDMDLSRTPSELLADVFHRLRKIVLSKREEIILAQSYFMLGTCAFCSARVSRDLGLLYLEYARHQTLTVPSEICFYSCISKELLLRDDFVKQIDYYINQFERQPERR